MSADLATVADPVSAASSADAVAPDAGPPLSPEEAAAQEAAARERAAKDAAETEAAEREAQLQRLLQRMQKSADFPSLKDSIRGIQKISRSETAHLRALTDEVLSDVGLTNKLLRLINTAFYGSVGGGSITSMKRAVALMGFQSIGMLAASLALFDRLPKGPDGERVRGEFRHALLAALLASEFCPAHKQQENAYLSALFQNLGPMLAWMHFRDEAEQVEAELAEAGTTARDCDHATLQKVSRGVLGMGYEDLGVEVAGQWGWPEELQSALRRLEPRDPEVAALPDERLRIACTGANHLARALLALESPTPEAIEALCLDFAARYGVPLGLGPETLAEMVERARAEWAEMTLVLGLPGAAAGASKGGGKTGAKVDQAKAAATNGVRAGQASPASAPVKAAVNAGAPAPRRPVVVPPAVTAALTRGLEAVSQHAMSDAPLGEVMQLLMTHMHEALRLQRVLLCLRDGASGELRGRLGIGERAGALAPVFRVPMQPPSDLFGLLCAKNADTLISDAGDGLVAQRLPAWFHQQIKAPTFLLLPLQLGGQPLGLIYADRHQAHSLQVGDGELTLLKAMRNQLVMAMRLRGAIG